MPEQTSARPEAFGAALRAGRLVFDGAMGTSLYDRGNGFARCFEELNLSRPELVRAVHQNFVAAGCAVLETNTFGANRLRLARHGCADKLREINAAGVRLAREVAGARAFVVGVLGPTGPTLAALPEAQREQVVSAFREQVAALLEAGVDALIFETFRQTDELQLALRGAREAGSGELPLIACVSFDEAGTSADGQLPEQVAEQLASLQVAALGVNCGTGPAAVYEAITRMTGPRLPLVAIPNAGLPRQLDGKLIYPSTPADFGLCARRLYEAGVHAVGGCCGTTPDHIREVFAAACAVVR
jgi:methionine synthase / methylenetetrahydrofolate reductase(NADPH)